MRLEETDPTPDEFAAHMTRVKRFAGAAGALGAAAGVCFSITYLLQTENPKMRGVITMPLVCGFGLSAMVTGIALLFAPSRFYTSDKGQEYLQTIGTQNVLVARIVVLIFLLLGCGVITVFVLGALQMAGIIEQPPPR
jgi:hypothetical protein